MQSRSFRDDFSKKQNHQTSLFRQHHCHFRQKRYDRYFLTKETNVRPSGWTAEGRQEQTDKQPNNPSGIRTLVGSNVGLLGEISVRFYGSARINVPPSVPAIVSKSSFSMRPARRQTVPNRRHKLPRKRKRRQQAQVWLHLPRTQNMVYGSSNYRKEDL